MKACASVCLLVLLSAFCLQCAASRPLQDGELRPSVMLMRTTGINVRPLHCNLALYCSLQRRVHHTQATNVLFFTGVDVALSNEQGRQLLNEAEWSDDGMFTALISFSCRFILLQVNVIAS